MRVWQQVIFATEDDPRTGQAGVVLGEGEDGAALVHWDSGVAELVPVADLRAL